MMRSRPLLCSSFGCLMLRHTNYTMTCLSSSQARVQVRLLICLFFFKVMTVLSFILSPFTYVFLCMYSWRQYMCVAVFGWTCYWYNECALGLFNGHGGFEAERLGPLVPPHTAGQPETAAELPGNTPAPAADAQNWCTNQHCTCSCICCEGSDKILYLWF